MFDFKHSGGDNSDRQWWLRLRCEEFWPRPITLPPLEVLLRFTIAINVSVCMPVSHHISKTILLVHVVHILWPGHSLAVLRYVMCFRFCVAFAQARKKVAYTPSDAPGASPARNRMLTIASLFICMIPTRDIFYESVTDQSRDLWRRRGVRRCHWSICGWEAVPRGVRWFWLVPACWPCHLSTS